MTLAYSICEVLQNALIINTVLMCLIVAMTQTNFNDGYINKYIKDVLIHGVCIIVIISFVINRYDEYMHPHTPNIIYDKSNN